MSALRRSVERARGGSDSDDAGDEAKAPAKKAAPAKATTAKKAAPATSTAAKKTAAAKKSADKPPAKRARRSA